MYITDLPAETIAWPNVNSTCVRRYTVKTLLQYIFAGISNQLADAVVVTDVDSIDGCEDENTREALICALAGLSRFYDVNIDLCFKTLSDTSWIDAYSNIMLVKE